MPDTIDPLATHTALNAAGAGDEAREFLRRQGEVSLKQSRLLDLQIENLQKADEFENSHLRWRRFNEQMSGALQIMLVLVGLAIVVAIGAAVWSAAGDKGLVVEAFSVPPDLAQKGLTGEVIANKILDRLIAFQAQTVSMRAPASYANNWGDDIKVQIPDTGVSIGELNRVLHQWLGHATRITGEVYRTPTGIALSARVGGESTPVLKSGEADIEALIQSAAERIYRATQPYRYAAWLEDHGRLAEANALLQAIVDTGDSHERAWAYNGLAHNTIFAGDVAGAEVFAHKAVASDPGLVLPRFNVAGGEVYLGHDEGALIAGRAALEVAAQGDPTMVQTALAQNVIAERTQLAELIGDFATALDLARQRERLDDVENARLDLIELCGLLHDLACFRAALASLVPSTDGETLLQRQASVQEAAAGLGQWEALAQAAPGFHAAVLRDPFSRGALRFTDTPLWALAAAHRGDLKRAHALIDTTPPDCNPCLRVRGQIDAIAHNWAGAAYWFARAAASAPSVPFAQTDWARMLLEKGDFDNAIAHLSIANHLGPKFADPLELWGEALIAKNRSDLALAKFEDAARTAPNWGRLHLKWGEALYWLGRKDDARKQFDLATALWLTPAETGELSRMGARHG